MIIKFKVSNYLSFKDEVSFDLMSSEITQFHENVYETENVGILKSSIIYGANGSGKSNILRAMQFYVEFILRGFKALEEEDKIPRIPFELDAESKNSPTFMSIQLSTLDNNIYEHSISFNDDSVLTEKFSVFEDDDFVCLFERDAEKISYSKEKYSQDKRDLIKSLIDALSKPNVLFLSLLSSTNLEDDAITNFVSELKKLNL